MMEANKTETVAATMLSGESPSGDSPPRKRGRPKGSKNRPRDPNTGERINTPKESSNGDKPFVYIPDSAGIKAASEAFNIIWFLAAPFIKCRPLTDDEKLMAGEALDPILQKYIPMYGDWKYEINLAMVIVGLYQVCRIKEDKKESESSAEVIE